jgi:small subunit ribosomal protein S20
MPVTKTAKRALRSSLRKKSVNSKIISALEISLRKAKKSGKSDQINKAISMADIAAKKKIIHKNKAARIKSNLAKNLPKSAANAKKPTKKSKASKK